MPEPQTTAPSASGTVRQRPRALRSLHLAVLLALGGCAQTGGGLAEVARTLSTPGTLPTALAPQAPPTLPGGMALPVPKVQPYAPVRTEQSTAALFAKGTVSGTDLLAEFTQLRDAVRDQRGASGWGRFQASLNGEANGGGKESSGGDLGSLLADTLKSVAMAKLEEQVMTLAFGSSSKSADGFLSRLTDSPDLLARETVKLPALKNANANQRRMVLSLAVLAIGSSIARKTLEQAEADFAAIETGYASMLKRREAAAGLLIDALQNNRLGTGASVGLAEPTLVAMRQRLAGADTKAFVNDLGLQNIALAYLRATDPSAWDEYKVTSDGMLKSRQAYLRSIAGVAAFAGITFQVAREFQRLHKNKSWVEVLTALPLGIEIGRNLVPAVPKVFNVALHGAVLQPLRSFDRFRLRNPAGEVTLRSADAVFTALKERRLDTTFGDALFMTDAPGLLARVGQCDPAAAGRMIDQLLSPAERAEFATRWLAAGDAAEAFSFANAFEAPRPGTREGELAQRLLERSHRGRTDDQSRTLADLQRKVVERSGRWDDNELMRLVLANRETGIENVSLTLNDTALRLVPSMDAVTAYEELASSCRTSVAGAPVTVPTTGAVPAAATASGPAKTGAGTRTTPARPPGAASQPGQGARRPAKPPAAASAPAPTR